MFKSSLFKVYILFVFVALVCTPGRVAYANKECQAKKHAINPEIVLDVQIAKPYILYDRTIKEIHIETNKGESRLSSEGMEALWSTRESTTMGYAEGAMASMFSSGYVAKPFDRYGTYYCPFFKKLEIHIIYRTLIRIPSEFKGGGCVHDVIMEHEMRHHKANRDSFERYMTQLRKDLPEMIAYYERVPVKRGLVQGQFNMMYAAVQDAVKLYIREYAQKEAAKINAQIDSPESYAADARKMEACKEKPHWRKTR